MKNLKQTFAFIFCLSIHFSFAGGHPSELDLTGLRTITMDEEAPVEDLLFGGSEDTAMQQLKLTGLANIHKMEEQPVQDVFFTEEEMAQYGTKLLEVILAQLKPVPQEIEDPAGEPELELGNH